MDAVFNQMSEIVEKYVRHWKTDFTEHDVPAYNSMPEGTKFVWVVRECGTFICGVADSMNEDTWFKRWFKVPLALEEMKKNVAESAEIIIGEFPREQFYVVEKGISIKKLTQQKALEVCKYKEAK